MFFPISGAHISPIYLVIVGFLIGILGGFFGVGGSFIAGPALRAIPAAYREVAYSLGATRLQMIRKIVLPQAVGGILTGGILAISRGAGEVAPILFTGAAYYLPYLPKKLNDQFMEMGYHIYVMATQSPDVEATKPILYATVFVLLVVTFALNSTAIWIRSRIRRKLRLAR